MTDQQQETSKHIRPKLRKPGVASSSPSVNHDEVEQTRKKLESWMGVGAGSSAKSNAGKSKSPSVVVSSKKTTTAATISNAPAPKFSAAAAAAPKSTVTPKKSTARPAGILKAPKYSKKPSNGGDDEASALPASEEATTTPTTATPVCCKDVIVERDPTRPTRKVKPFRQQPKGPQTIDDFLLAGKEQAIEGYTPSLASSGAGNNNSASNSSSVRFDDNAHNESAISPKDMTNVDDQDKDDSSKEEEDDPLYINSLADLMEAAGETLPDGPIDSDTQMVEANLEFSVMTQEEYDNRKAALKQQEEEERQEQMKMFMGKIDIFGDDNNDDDASGEENDDDAMMELILGGGFNGDDDNDNDQIHYDDQDDNLPESAPRAFRLLWDALSVWMTPQTVVYVKALQDGGCNNDALSSHQVTPMFDRSDIGSSRCAGVMAMLKLYLSSCMEELKYPSDERRKAEKRLTDILRTFDYSRENPKLHVSHWKAMTCVLLDMVMKDDSDTPASDRLIPSSVADLDVSAEEYTYLTQKTVMTFAQE